jgi:hypothetical protein
MSADLFSIGHILKTLLALVGVCAFSAIVIVYILPKLKKSPAQGSEAIGMKVVARERIDANNTLLTLEDAQGSRFLFASSSNGLSLLGTFNEKGAFSEKFKETRN